MPIDPKRVQAVFLAAVEQTERSARAGLLDRECRDDNELRHRVEALLRANDEPGSYLDQPAVGLADKQAVAEATTGFEATQSYSSPDPTPGVVIAGRYTLEQKIGEGGMGEVWVAKQSEPVKRKVALKLIKAGMDSKSVIQRFEQERQALALMDHPNIAKVLDGGIDINPLTPGPSPRGGEGRNTGRPFFVMELVNGLPLTKFCDETKLGIKERLELFVPICQAVQHAHQKGIVHRDLKPSNILITMIDGKPVPKVIDFGVAKATSGRLTDESLSTQFGAVVGTLEYMSPEQAGFSGEDIDTRADIYSLGVILYELLTGLRPFDSKKLKKAALDEMIRMIREEEPSKPSTRLSTDESLPSLAASRHIEPNKLTALLRGELDWVVMKCLEKQRDRRYESANGLARDIQRYLNEEVVEARPPSTGYRLRKFVARNRGKVIAAAVVAFSLILGLIGTTGGMLWAISEKKRAHDATIAEGIARTEAQQRANELERVASFQAEQLSKIDVPLMGMRLRDAFLAKVRNTAKRSQLSPQEVDRRVAEADKIMSGIDFTGIATEALEENIFKRALTAIHQNFADQALVKARLLQTVSDSLVSLGMFAQANAPQDEALKLRQSKLSQDHPDTLTSFNASACLYGYQGKLEEAKPLFTEVIQKRRRILGNDHPDTLTSIFGMGTLLYLQGQYAQAEPYFLEALEKRRTTLGQHHPATLQSLRTQGMLRLAQGKLNESETLLREAEDTCRRALGADHEDTIKAKNNLSVTLKWLGKYSESEVLDRAVMQSRQKQLGDHHPDTLTAMANLGETLRKLKKYADAETLLREVMNRQRLLLGDDHPDTLVSISRMGVLLYDMGQYVKAEPFYRETLDGRRRRLGNEHPNTLTAMNNLGLLLTTLKRYADAEAMYRDVLEIERRVNGVDHPRTLTILFNYGKLQFEQDKFKEAEPVIRDALERHRRILGNSHPDTQRTLQALGVVLMKLNRYSEAEPLLHECYTLRLGIKPPNDSDIAEAGSLLGEAVTKQGRYAEAEPMLLGAFTKLEPKASINLKLDAGRRIVELYEAWNRAEPGRGHDAKVTEWKKQLEATNTTSAPEKKQP